VLARMRLPFIANGEAAPRCQAVDEFTRPVGGTIIDNYPLEIAKRLAYKAFVNARKQRRPVVRCRCDSDLRGLEQAERIEADDRALTASRVRNAAERLLVAPAVALRPSHRVSPPALPSSIDFFSWPRLEA
jgi:hypothetical protein